MMRSLFFLFAALLLATAGYGNEINYAVLAIPRPLLQHASVVMRNEETRFEILGPGETVLYKKYALTILNENGDDYAGFYEWYDRFDQVRSIEGNLYDAMGRQLKKVKGKDIQDVSGSDGSSLADDFRIKLHNFYCKQYPYTVEYEVEIKASHTFYFPDWRPQRFEHMAVQKSSYTLVAPEGYTVRYKSFNYKGEPVVTREKNRKITTWQVGDLPAVTYPFAAPCRSELTTSVVLAPTGFGIGDYKGNMSDWKEFGKFIYALKKDRDQLPAPVAQQVQQLTAGLSDDREKVKALYAFLQKNTRYISIQLGIGGWQPFDAAFVAQKGYGDCKALSNYMFSLLKAAGIQSYYTLVNSGGDFRNHQLMDDFPSNQFNHVILCVPLKADTIWLECTSQTLAAGYMGTHTGNRKALLIDEQGGTVVATPRYGLQENRQLRSVKGVVDAAGDLKVMIHTVYSGIQQEEVHEMLAHLSKEKVKKVLNEELNLTTYDINNFKYAEKADRIPEVIEDLELQASKFATVSGKRLFLVPNLLNQSTTRLTDSSERKHDFVFDLAWRDVDTVELEVPAGYVPEVVPPEVKLQTPFGAYASSVRLVDNRLFLLRTREQYAGRFPASDKDALARYYEAIYKADRARVVLVKKAE
ncbi:DUF3857 and transglutaminase domain-containing protein [Paraflavisolibacter sp. H34]|uniref:DUF3857 domain-containing transglutaminase family protein n=1 Tax=Huijunlia imazamoxiresistens TaxID=3127457 RepID=UPI003017FC6B